MCRETWNILLWTFFTTLSKWKHIAAGCKVLLRFFFVFYMCVYIHRREILINLIRDYRTFSIFSPFVICCNNSEIYLRCKLFLSRTISSVYSLLYQQSYCQFVINNISFILFFYYLKYFFNTYCVLRANTTILYIITGRAHALKVTF